MDIAYIGYSEVLLEQLLKKMTCTMSKKLYMFLTELMNDI